ncbi:hypothetical protein GCM10022253_29110 [Sphingomonas endophytica]
MPRIGEQRDRLVQEPGDALGNDIAEVERDPDREHMIPALGRGGMCMRMAVIVTVLMIVTVIVVVMVPVTHARHLPSGRGG